MDGSAADVRLVRFGSAAALALGLLAAAPAAAQEPEPANETPVGCTVSVGIASREKGDVDERFRGLPSAFGSVQLWKEQAWKLRFGEAGRMSLPNGTELSVQPVHVRGRTLSMKVDLPGVVNTKLRLQNHSPLVVGALPHEDGYLVIRVEPEFTDHLPAESGENTTIPVNSERRD
jgi:hypothetical protein